MRPTSPDDPSSKAVDLAFGALVFTARALDVPYASRWWERAWNWVSKRDVVVRTRLFGADVLLPPSAVYPVFARRWRTYNDPVVELTHLVGRALGRPANVVDVGAAMGDTVLLLRSRCGADLGRVLTIEGDPTHAAFLRRNLASDERTTVVEAVLSDSDRARALVRNPLGTATAVGQGHVAARTLDDVIDEQNFTPDVLKIDTDGYDGRVLSGARSLLRQHQPAVIFEWDPGSFDATGNSRLEPFEVLDSAGYRSFIWFTKYGEFSHYMDGYSPASVAAHAELCLRTTVRPEWHYDVVALGPAVKIDTVALADLRFAATSRRS